LLIFFAFFAGFSTLYQSGSPARSALITESVQANKTATAYSTLMAIGQITTMVTASAGGYIALQVGYTPIFQITLIGEILGIGVMWLFLTETHQNRLKTKSSFIESLKEALLPERKILNLYLILALTGIGYGTGYSLFFGALVDTYKFTPFEIGMLSTAFSLTWGISSIPLGKLADRVGRKRMLLGSCICAFVTVIGFLAFRSFPFLLLFQMVSGIDPAFWIPSWISLVSEKMEPHERSRAIGKLDAYNRFLMIPAPYLAGILYTNYGFSAPLLVQLIFVTCTTALVFNIKESKQKS
jgi:MFS family permease